MAIFGLVGVRFARQAEAIAVGPASSTLDETCLGFADSQTSTKRIHTGACATLRSRRPRA